MFIQKWFRPVTLSLLTALPIASALAQAPTRLRIDTPTHLNRCGGKIAFTHQESHVLKFKNVENCSNIEIEGTQQIFKLEGKGQLRSGEYKIPFNELRGSRVTVKSNSGKHREHFYLPNTAARHASEIHFGSHGSCGGSVELVKSLVTTISLSDVVHCDTLVLEDNRTHKRLNPADLVQSGRYFGGEFSYQLHGKSPSDFRIVVASKNRGFRDDFVPEMECEYEAVSAALSKHGLADFYRSEATVVPEGRSRKGNLKFSVSVPSRIGYNDSKTIQIVARPGSCEVVN